jgi:carbon monoxide dehydrogenase subunit G
MSALRRSLTVQAPVGRVAAYLSDLTTSVDWDPHTQSCTRLDDGPLGLGARYEHTRAYGPYRATVTFEVVEYEPGAHIVWRGDTELAEGREEFEFAAGDDGTVVTHAVEVRLRGVARFGQRLVPAVMARIADDGTQRLRESLERLT